MTAVRIAHRDVVIDTAAHETIDEEVALDGAVPPVLTDMRRDAKRLL
jgi:hypothetical protein